MLPSSQLMDVPSTRTPTRRRKETGGRDEPNPPAPSSVLGRGNFKMSPTRIPHATTCSGRIRPWTTPAQTLPPPTPPPLAIACFAIQHAAQGQAASQAAKTLAGECVHHHEEHVTTWPITHPLARIFARTGWALALARRGLVSWRRRCGRRRSTLSITMLLRAPALPSVGAGAIAPTGFGPAPPPRLLPAGSRAIPALRAWRQEPALAAFEQAAANATRTVGLLPDACDEMQ